MKYVFLLLATALFGGAAIAQPTIKFLEETHDFGEVIEGKLASHEFVVSNMGNQPLILSNVQASCGCTSPVWSKEPIMPGKSGIVKAMYNSVGRPGQFNKSLTITSNAANGTKTVFVKGNVIKKEDKVYTDEQKKNSAKLLIEKGSYKVGKLETGQKGIAKITVMNKGISPLEIDNVTSPCGCTTFTVGKSQIKAGESAILEVAIAPKQKGPFKEEISISSSDVNTPNFRVFLEGEAVESLGASPMKEAGGANLFK